MVLDVSGRVLDKSPLRTKLKRALRAAVKRRGVRVQASESTLDELTGLAGCAVGRASCRRQLTGSLLVDEIVACTLSKGMRDGKLRARFVRIRSDGSMMSEVVVVAGKNRSAQVRSFQRHAKRLVRKKLNAPADPSYEAEVEPAPAPAEKPPPVAVAEPSPAPRVVEPEPATRLVEPESAPEPTAAEPEQPDPVVRDDPASASRLSKVRGRTWATFGISAGLALGAAASFALARSRQGDIDAAPVASEADLIRLESLEDSARWRYNLANIAGIAALGALATAAVFVSLDMRAEHSSIALVPTRHGLLVSLGESW